MKLQNRAAFYVISPSLGRKYPRAYCKNGEISRELAPARASDKEWSAVFMPMPD
ncbi:hypothetical protein [Cellvibrio zantedeschiae]|uniref:hypothetical protein n=1 Tax=Cellvibrio zantedeschiae TaxID=1237077 RepID=UPI001676CE36|nr:hypothetical protein [Cellvibrio zantedeschiae]